MAMIDDDRPPPRLSFMMTPANGLLSTGGPLQVD